MDGNSVSTQHQGSFSLLQICFQYTDVKKGLAGTNTTYFGEQFSRNQFPRFSCSEQHCCSMSHLTGWVRKPNISVLQVHLCKWRLFFPLKHHLRGTEINNWEPKSDQHLRIFLCVNRLQGKKYKSILIQCKIWVKSCLVKELTHRGNKSVYSNTECLHEDINHTKCFPPYIVCGQIYIKMPTNV